MDLGYHGLVKNYVHCLRKRRVSSVRLRYGLSLLFRKLTPVQASPQGELKPGVCGVVVADVSKHNKIDLNLYLAQMQPITSSTVP